jgi:mRNA interferase MazF
MESLAAGSVVLIPFPFSDLSQSKIRPALVLANAERGDWILCQITSKPYADQRAMRLDQTDFASGGLELTSYVRPGKLFTANEALMIETVGQLRTDKFRVVLKAVAEVFLPTP